MNVGSKESSPPLRTNRSVAWASRSGRDAELAVLEHLGVPDPDLRPARPPHREPQPADQVLPEVDERRARTARSRSAPAAASRAARRAARSPGPAPRCRTPSAPRPGTGRPSRGRAAARRWSVRRRGRRRSCPTGRPSTSRRCRPPARARPRRRIDSWAISPSRSPYSARPPRKPSRPRHQPLPSATVSTEPSRSRAVTSCERYRSRHSYADQPGERTSGETGTPSSEHSCTPRLETCRTADATAP